VPIARTLVRETELRELLFEVQIGDVWHGHVLLRDQHHQTIL
jgi:hypothetical protein